jgi:hypothetical protein
VNPGKNKPWPERRKAVEKPDLPKEAPPALVLNYYKSLVVLLQRKDEGDRACRMPFSSWRILQHRLDGIVGRLGRAGPVKEGREPTPVHKLQGSDQANPLKKQDKTTNNHLKTPLEAVFGAEIVPCSQHSRTPLKDPLDRPLFMSL